MGFCARSPWANRRNITSSAILGALMPGSLLPLLSFFTCDAQSCCPKCLSELRTKTGQLAEPALQSVRSFLPTTMLDCPQEEVASVSSTYYVPCVAMSVCLAVFASVPSHTLATIDLGVSQLHAIPLRPSRHISPAGVCHKLCINIPCCSMFMSS